VRALPCGLSLCALSQAFARKRGENGRRRECVGERGRERGREGEGMERLSDKSEGGRGVKGGEGG